MSLRARILSVALTAAAVVAAAPAPTAESRPPALAPTAKDATKVPAVPLMFERNLGQSDPAVRFLALGVEPQDVVPRKQESGEGRIVADTAVGPMPIVVVKPRIEVSGALLG